MLVPADSQLREKIRDVNKASFFPHSVCSRNIFTVHAWFISLTVKNGTNTTVACEIAGLS